MTNISEPVEDAQKSPKTAQHAESVAWDSQRWSAALADARWRHTVLELRVKDALAKLERVPPHYRLSEIIAAEHILRGALTDGVAKAEGDPLA